MQLCRILLQQVNNSSHASCVPNVLATFGTRLNRITFVSHPGVMAVSRLLEMRFLTRPRAVLKQENVDAIKEFDPELARKAQIAVDNNLTINFMELEHIDNEDYFKKIQTEKELLEKIRKETMNLNSSNGYELSKDLLKSIHNLSEVPRSLRTKDLFLDEETLNVQKGLREDLQLQDLVHQYVNNGKKLCNNPQPSKLSSSDPKIGIIENSPKNK